MVLAIALALSLQVPGPSPSPSPEAELRFRDSVDVSQVVLDARILAADGNPRTAITPGELRLTVDGHEVPVDTVTWVPDGPPVAPPHRPVVSAPAPPTLPGEAPRPGRRIVFLFQKDLHGSRAPGLLSMARRAKEIVGGLAPEDRVAVLSYDFSLHFWLDFTADAAQVAHAIDRGVLFGENGPGPEHPQPSLLAFYDWKAAINAGSLEQGLTVVGRALRAIPGPKSLVLIGHGTGRGGLAEGIWLDGDYTRARRVLEQARTAVYALDVTDADYHQLQFAMEQVAADTGGFYAKTHEFVASTMARLRGALAGHHVIAFTPPQLPHGFHAIRLDLRQGGGEVFTMPGYTD